MGSHLYLACLAAAWLLALAGPASHAGPLRELIEQRRAARPSAEFATAPGSASSSVAAQAIRDIPYGDDRLQRFDAYLPQRVAGPVIFMVHGGGWRHGDKASRDVVDNKAGHWPAQGFVFISANTR